MKEYTLEVNQIERLRRIASICVVVVTVIVASIPFVLLIKSGVEDLRWRYEYKMYHRTTRMGISIGQGGLDEYYDIYALATPFVGADVGSYTYQWTRRAYPSKRWETVAEDSRYIKFTEEQPYIYRVFVSDAFGDEVGSSYFYTKRKYNFRSYDEFWDRLILTAAVVLVGFLIHKRVNIVLNKIAKGMLGEGNQS